MVCEKREWNRESNCHAKEGMSSLVNGDSHQPDRSYKSLSSLAVYGVVPVEYIALILLLPFFPLTFSFSFASLFLLFFVFFIIHFTQVVLNIRLDTLTVGSTKGGIAPRPCGFRLGKGMRSAGSNSQLKKCNKIAAASSTSCSATNRPEHTPVPPPKGRRLLF